MAHFDGARYRAKKPMPAPNTFVSVEGFLSILTQFEVEQGSLAMRDIHLSVDNMTFLGNACVSTPSRGPGSWHVCCPT
jgi:hypothetical protein